MLLKKSQHRKWSVAALGLALLAATACSDSASSAGTEEYSFTLASAVAQSHPSGQATTMWMERVEELTDGRVSFDATWSGALLPGSELFAGAADGRVDIVHTSSSWHMAELPLTSVVTLPFITTDGEASTRALNELYETNEEFSSEFETQGTELISTQPLDAIFLGSSSSFGDVDALQGQQIRATGEWIEALSLVGVEPVGVAYEETYEAVQRGVVDGYALNWEAIYDLQLNEVAPVVEDPGIGQVSNMLLIGNSQVMEGLPQDIRDAFDQATAEHVDALSQLYESQSEEQCGLMVDSGTTFTSWNESASSEWRNQVSDDVSQSWVNSKSDPAIAQEFFDDYTTLMNELSGESTWNPGIEICQSLQTD